VSAKQVLGAILNMIFRLSIACIVVVLVYRAGMYAYHFGYMVFSEGSAEVAPGRDVMVTVMEGESLSDVGETLERRGLVKDSNIFLVQGILLEYKDKIMPGEYKLNTSMTSEEMMVIMSGGSLETEETTDSET